MHVLMYSTKRLECYIVFAMTFCTKPFVVYSTPCRVANEFPGFLSVKGSAIRAGHWLLKTFDKNWIQDSDTDCNKVESVHVCRENITKYLSVYFFAVKVIFSGACLNVLLVLSTNV